MSKQQDGGKRVSVIARDWKFSQSTGTMILKDKVRNFKTIKGSEPMRSTAITKQRTRPIHETEKLLHMWMEDEIPPKMDTFSLFALKDEGEKFISDIEGSCQKKKTTVKNL